MDEFFFTEVLPILSSIESPSDGSPGGSRSEFDIDDKGNDETQLQESQPPVSSQPISLDKYTESLLAIKKRFIASNISFTPKKCGFLSGPAGKQGCQSSNDKTAINSTILTKIEQYRFKCWSSAINLIEPGDVDMRRFSDYDGSVSYGKFLTKKFTIHKLIQNYVDTIFELECLIAMVDVIVALEPNIIVVLSVGLLVYMVYLYDQTSKITGIVYREDIEFYRNELMPGCVMIIMKAIVYRPLGWDPYVIIERHNVKKVVQGFAYKYDVNGLLDMGENGLKVDIDFEFQ